MLNDCDCDGKTRAVPQYTHFLAKSQTIYQLIDVAIAQLERNLKLCSHPAPALTLLDRSITHLIFDAGADG